MDRDGTIRVEVVFALKERQELVALTVPAGTSVADAIERSAIAAKFPQHDLDACHVGIWGHFVERERPLEDGDRVEIYRSLAIDPREARRKLAAEGKSMGRREPGENDS